MPQSQSPTSTTSKGSDDNIPSNTRMSMSEAALRKKKNADAQAAFRARRANYIATLEETVTNLEEVVIQLQDSCKDAKSEAAELRAENHRLRLAHRERERFWRALWQAKNTGQPPPDAPGDDFSIPSYSPVHTPISTVGPSLPYPDDGMRIPPSVDPSTSLAATTSYVPAQPQDYAQRSQMTGFEHDVSGDTRSQAMDSQRIPRYDTSYPPYAPMESPVRETWSTNEISPLEGADPSSSPTYIESPSLTAAETPYGPRFPVNEDQKIPLGPMTPGYMFPVSRSLSPASTPTSTSSTSAVMPFQYSYTEGSVVDRTEFPYRRQGSGHGPELTLHGGTANIPVAGSSGENVRYRIGTRGGPPGSSISPYSRTENGSHERESDDGEPYHYATRTRHRHSATTSRTSRSPSPGSPQICGTLAVIKAQAFGALRRTRTRSKRSSEGAAKAAVEALEARGIGLGISAPGAKRPRLNHGDNSDMQI